MAKHRSILFLIVSCCMLSYAPLQETTVLKEPALAAFHYLNQIRENPAAFSKKTGVNLSAIKPSPLLKWNEMLARQAELKAADMATKNYFSHVDKQGYGMNYYVNQAGYTLPEHWLSNKTNNQIESLGANTSGPGNFINQLIIDKDDKSKGHRRHLLSADDFYKDNSQIGIGIAHNPNSTYKYYCCILIAPAYLKK